MALNYSKNYYEILDVNIDSTSEEIKSAYRRLARKYHPDINKTAEAIEKFKSIIEAYKILSNPEEREKYNMVKGLFKSAAYKAKEDESVDVRADKKTKKDDLKEDLHIYDENSNKHKDVNSKKFNIFEKMFKKSKSKAGDIHTDVVISQEEAVLGCKRIVHILTTKTCTKCMGHKFINGNKCDNCDGKGEISSRKKIIVTIPKGVKNGSKLRIKGEGKSGNEICGDLFIHIKINAPQNVKIEKNNIYYNIGITPYEAVLGGEILINIFDSKIRLKIPPNTVSGQKFRIANEGLKKNGKIGDLIVTVTIEISKDLSDDERKLYEKLKILSSRKNGSKN